MEEKLIKEFKFLYSEEIIKRVVFVESLQYIYVECESGYTYKVEYNGGNITTSCLDY